MSSKYEGWNWALDDLSGMEVLTSAAERGAEVMLAEIKDSLGVSCDGETIEFWALDYETIGKWSFLKEMEIFCENHTDDDIDRVINNLRKVIAVMEKMKEND